MALLLFQHAPWLRVQICGNLLQRGAVAHKTFQALKIGNWDFEFPSQKRWPGALRVSPALTPLREGLEEQVADRGHFLPRVLYTEV